MRRKYTALQCCLRESINLDNHNHVDEAITLFLKLQADYDCADARISKCASFFSAGSIFTLVASILAAIMPMPLSWILASFALTISTLPISAGCLFYRHYIFQRQLRRSINLLTLIDEAIADGLTLSTTQLISKYFDTVFNRKG